MSTKLISASARFTQALTFCLCLPIVGFTTVLAEPAKKRAGKTGAIMEGFGAKNPLCLEWYNHCQVCRREPGGGIICSTPGIACLPQKIICRIETAPQKQTPGMKPGADRVREK